MLQVKITHLYLVLMLFLCKTSNFSICEICCDCLYDSEEENINNDINEEDKKIKDAIMRHLKLDENKLDGIIKKLKKIKNKKEKFKKVVEEVMDIDWENPMYPNTLIPWEKNKCWYIARFHLMLNNPYFLKFFLICDKINKKKKTVLYEVCKLIKQCINLPNFQKSKSQNPGVTIDKIMDCFYKDGKYEEIIETHHIKDHMQYDLALRPMYIEAALNQDIDSLFEFEDDIFPFACGIPPFGTYVLDLKEVYKNKEDYDNIFSLIEKKEDSLLGISVIDIDQNHTYAIVKNNGEWFLKDSLKKDKGGKITVDDVANLCKDNLDKYKNREEQTLFFYKLNKCENLELLLGDLEELL